jgi:hypothetical protein
MKFSLVIRNKRESLLISTSYLPPISYVSACIHANEIIIEKFETYTKQTSRNHCIIYGPNGRQQLSIPVIKVNGNHTKSKDIRISDSMPWQKMHWRSIQTAYSNSPFFLYYSDYFVTFFEKKQEFLVDFNTSLLETIILILKDEKKISGTTKFEKEVSEMDDFRNLWGRKNYKIPYDFPEYTEVFSSRHGFIPDLSILDLIFNLGPEARQYLEKLPV